MKFLWADFRREAGAWAIWSDRQNREQVNTYLVIKGQSPRSKTLKKDN